MLRAFSLLVLDRSWRGLPSDVHWLARPLMKVLALDEAVPPPRCVYLERGLEPATKPEGTLAFGDESTDSSLRGRGWCRG